MKKLMSIFILCGLFLGNFFAQEANATIWKSAATIHADSHSSGNQNYHKRLIFSEVSNESEDSEEKTNLEIQFANYQDIISEILYLKITLKEIKINPVTHLSHKNAFPLFIKNRSILV